jgi:hypothetical protein
MLLLPLAPKLARPGPLELMDCLLSPSEEPGREGIIALMLDGDASLNFAQCVVWEQRRYDALSRDISLASKLLCQGMHEALA